jgi:AraC family transcriptional regulator, transcriptional activator of pobA
MSKIPVYSICNLVGENHKDIALLAKMLRVFLNENPNIVFPHKHDFYQLLYLTKGAGKHIIDFETYPVAAGYFYFLSPGMMHTWDFEDNTEGYLVNFQGSFFQKTFNNESYLSQFPFFHSINNAPFMIIPTDLHDSIEGVLKRILDEYEHKKILFEEVIRANLVHLFVELTRSYMPKVVSFDATYNNIQIVREFEKWVDKFYLEKKFPKEYALLLGITPNYLNEICVETVGKSAGQIIRERILLEAKRLLTYGKASIAEIAYQLNFEDNAYFSRFFKKYTHLTPDVFRQQNKI